MAILEEEVWVTLHPLNVRYYEELGYEIPRRRDINGKLRFSKGSRILVKVADLTEGCSVKLTKVCDDCGKQIPNQKVETIMKVRENGKDKCKKCGSINGGIKRKGNISYEKSLEFCAKKDNKDYLLLEFSDKNDRHPSQISYKSNDVFLWNCLNCKNEFPMVLNNRVSKNYNCPYCSGQKVLKGYNDLWTSHPNIAKLLKNPQRGYGLSHGSNQKEIFKCNQCGKETKKMINNVINQGYISCPKCGDGWSTGEKLLFNILEQLEVDFEIQKTFKWSDNKRYDFYVPTDTIIEVNGEQHYQHTGFKRTLEEEKENDQLKENFAKLNGIKNYIVIECARSEFAYLQSKIMESELGRKFDLSKVNWNECFEFACMSFVNTVSNMWKENKSVEEIAKKLKLSNVTIRTYLKQASQLGWCNYDPIRERNKGLSVGRVNKRKEIIQLTMEGEFVKSWNSATEAAKILGISQSHISSVCLEKKNSIGGFKWMHKNNYDLLNKINS
jgi:DNA-directed RNA polymerase subunit RPC12/RpoP